MDAVTVTAFAVLLMAVGGGDDGDRHWPASMLREYANRNLDVEHSDIYPHAGLVADDEVRALLSYLASVYNPNYHDDLPPTIWETDTVKNIIRKYGTEQAQRALEGGHDSILNYIVGLPNLDTDISGLHTLMWLRDWVTRVANITVVSGHMGAGKTDFALLLGEVWSHVLEENGEDHAVFSNITTCEQAESVTSMSKLKEMAERDSDEQFLVIWDEASSHASGYSGDAHDVQNQLRRFTRMIRKNGGALIIIGHAKGGADIHPDVRRLAQAVYKFNKKDGAIYYGIEEREYTDKVNDIGGIPPTNWDFDTEEESDWEWDLEDDEDEDDEVDDEIPWIQCRGLTTDGSACKQPQHSLNDHGFCSAHETQYQQYRDLLENAENQRCRGVNGDGTACMKPPQTPLNDHGYCPDHEDQYDPDDDVEVVQEGAEGADIQVEDGGAEYERCRGVNEDGEPCNISQDHLLDEDGYCHHHR